MMQLEQRHESASGHEWLSALLDGELDNSDAERVARQLVEDTSRMRCWAEYCLIGDALRGEVVVQPGFMQRMHKALEAEPTVLAPMPRRHTRINRSLAWMAVAAAVAAVTWMVWTALPPQTNAVQMAGKPEAVMIQASHLMPYLYAHQDFSHGVIAPPDMAFTRVTLVSTEERR